MRWLGLYGFSDAVHLGKQRFRWFDIRKDAVENVIKIVQCLKQAEESWLWLTEIGKRTGLHRKTVTRLIDKHLTLFVDQQSMEPFNVRMVRLKPGTDINAIFRYLSVMEKINNK